MAVKSPRQGVRRWIRRGRRALLLFLPLTLLALWLTLEHRPGWYRPVPLDPAAIQRARGEATNQVDVVGDRLVARKPFELVLTDRQVTEWLTALPDIWPEAGQAIPPEISEPAVRFADGGILIGAHVANKGWRVIVSVRLVVDIADDGSTVGLRLAGVYGGSLPFPRPLLERMVDRKLRQESGSQAAAAPEPRAVIQSADDIRSAKQLFDGIRTPNRFVWPNGRRPFRIEGITIRDGELRLRIRPL